MRAGPSAISPEERRGEYMGFLQMTFSLSLMVGPWAGTEILENFGTQVLWIGTFIFCLFTVAMFFLHGRKTLKTA